MVPRPHIDEALVARLVAGQFPQWARLAVAAVRPGGVDNRTFRLGPDLSVRLPSADGYRWQVEKEHRWLPMLAPQLPVVIPVPIARGEPADGYPFEWSVYPWLAGETAGIAQIADLTGFATMLAEFLVALARVPATDGPGPGPHNFFRGGPLAVYDEETRRAIDVLGDRIPTAAATDAWEAGLATTWDAPPVWFHGDVAEGNLLVTEGDLSAVIDFGTAGVGDPACDLSVAWTLLSGAAREAFRAGRGLDAATWDRGRAWTLWKALITLAPLADVDSEAARPAYRVMHEVLAERGDTGPAFRRSDPAR